MKKKDTAGGYFATFSSLICENMNEPTILRLAKPTKEELVEEKKELERERKEIENHKCNCDRCGYAEEYWG